jgi:hypothetical protein
MLVLLGEGICEVCRSGGMIYMMFHDDQFMHSSSTVGITDKRYLLSMPLRWAYVTFCMYVPSTMTIGSGIQVILTI